MTKHFDSIIIGAGQAGPSLAARLTKAGQRIAFAERKLFGGTCVNTGCTPTKAMVASAYAAQMARRGAEYGVHAGVVKVDLPEVMKRKNSILMKSRSGVEKQLRTMENCTVYHQQARFLSGTEVQMGEDVLSADRIFINVGGRPVIPNMPGINEIPYLTSSTILDLDVLPQHLIVVGGSYIGLEFAQMFRRFGSEVTVVEKGDRLVVHEDEDLSAAVKEILEAEGITVRLDSECITLSKCAEQVVVGTSCKSGEPASVGSHVLMAVGREPNTADLGLSLAGVKMDEKGYIVVDDQLRTSVPNIWAMGDCNGKGAFTHTAYNDYEIVAANLLDNDHRRVSDRIPCHAMYIDPPLAQIGMTEAQVRKSGRKALIGRRPMTRVNRAVEKGESHGFMKVLVDAESEKILGAAILGTGGDEAIHGILDIMYAGAPYTTLQRAVHIHPTVSELIPTMLDDLKPLE